MAEDTMRFQRIPEAQLPAFEDLFTLEDTPFNELNEAINSAPKKAKASAVVAHVSKKAKSVSPDRAKAIILSLKTLLGAMDMYHVSTIQASKDIVENALKQSTKLNSEHAGRYEKRLLSLLGNPHLILPSKALSLLTDHARTFGTIRIISDMRPVFGEDATALPHAWMLYHTLHFRCNLTKDAEEDIYIALDTADLREIEEAVKRATEKQEVLINQFTKLKLDYVTPDEVEA